MNIIRYIFKRLLIMIPVVLGVTIVIFTLLSFSGADPVRTILGEQAPADKVEALREEMGFNDPVPIRYLRWLRDALKGDFGVSYRTLLPVSNEIKTRIAPTAKLALASLIIVAVVGIPIGVSGAVKQDSVLDTVSNFSAFVLAAVPGFWLGLMLMLVFALELGWLPATGGTTWKHYILPSIALSGANTAAQLRVTRSAMLESIRQDYVRTARAKGQTERVITFKHELRNSMLPILTMFGITISGLVGGACVTEQTFAIAGIGSLLISAAKESDIPVAMAIITWIAIAVSIVNLIVDLLYCLIDPRIRATIGGTK